MQQTRPRMMRRAWMMRNRERHAQHLFRYSQQNARLAQQRRWPLVAPGAAGPGTAVRLQRPIQEAPVNPLEPLEP